MQMLKIGLCAVLAVVVVAVVIDWSARMDSKRAMASSRYEECVDVKFGMTPGEYREKNGTLPVCDYDQVIGEK